MHMLNGAENDVKGAAQPMSADCPFFSILSDGFVITFGLSLLFSFFQTLENR